MDIKIEKIWTFFKKAIVQWKYLKKKNKFRVCLEGTKEEFKENFNFEFVEECKVVEPTLKQLLMQHIKDFKELKDDVAELKNDVAELKNDVAELRVDVDKLKNDMAIIKSLPTIQKELKEKGLS